MKYNVGDEVACIGTEFSGTIIHYNDEDKSYMIFSEIGEYLYPLEEKYLIYKDKAHMHKNGYWYPFYVVSSDNKWIKTSEQLPQDGQEVLFVYNDGEPMIDMGFFYEDYYDDGVGFESNADYFVKLEYVTHWQPIPELPPKD